MKKIKVFEGTETFQAFRLAEKWCEDRGFCVASTCANAPTAIMYGYDSVVKCRNLTRAEKAIVHGKLEGNLRKGPVTLFAKPEFEELLS